MVGYYKELAELLYYLMIGDDHGPLGSLSTTAKPTVMLAGTGLMT